MKLLCTENTQAEHHTLENLVTHWSKKFWLSCDCPFLHPPDVHENQCEMSLCNKLGGAGLQCTSLTLSIHVVFNWHLPRQEIHWPVSHDYITSSCLEFIKVTCIFDVDRCSGTWPCMIGWKSSMAMQHWNGFLVYASNFMTGSEL